jgi:tetratricopeptide (TPR) repeat protein
VTKHLAALLLALALPLAGCASSAAEAEKEASAGLAKARAGEIAAAIGHFERALTLDEHNPKARYNLALAHLVFRRGPEAAAHLRRYLATRPDDAPARFELGRALALAGEREAAIAELQRAAALGFEDFQALEDGGFEAIEDDVRFVQLRVLLAQRAGVPAFPGAERPANGVGYGGVPVPVQLPGIGPARKCAGAAETGGEACVDHGRAVTAEK